MYILLSVIFICITLIIVVNSIQRNPITFIIHKKFEEVKVPEKELTEEDKKTLEDQNDMKDGINELIKFTQEFLGGDTDAESEHKAK